jgi:hypothetical protein
MHPNPLYAECVQRAAALLGGEGALAARLEVTPRLVGRWLDGHSAIPESMFLRVVDILLEIDLPPKPPAAPDDPKPLAP